MTHQTPLLVHCKDALAKGGRQIRNSAPIPVVPAHAQDYGRVACDGKCKRRNSKEQHELQPLPTYDTQPKQLPGTSYEVRSRYLVSNQPILLLVATLHSITHPTVVVGFTDGRTLAEELEGSRSPVLGHDAC